VAYPSGEYSIQSEAHIGGRKERKVIKDRNCDKDVALELLHEGICCSVKTRELKEGKVEPRHHKLHIYNKLFAQIHSCEEEVALVYV
jgi:hypothetical protein